MLAILQDISGEDALSSVEERAGRAEHGCGWWCGDVDCSNAVKAASSVRPVAAEAAGTE